MSDDQYLINRARQVIEVNMKPTLTIPQPEAEALLRRIRELESRLATAEADALERAAKWHDGRALQIIQQTKMHDFDNGPAKVMSCEDGSIAVAHHRQSAAAIRSLNPKADE